MLTCPTPIQAEEELFKKLVKKFGQSSKAWTLFGQFYLTQGRPNEARDLLPRSLKSLEKRKRESLTCRSLRVRRRANCLFSCSFCLSPLLPFLHPPNPPFPFQSFFNTTDVKTITQFALLEFKLGDAERGRTIFEGIMDSYPKRLDLWFVYVDQEIKQHNVTGVRGLFERMLAGRLSSSELSLSTQGRASTKLTSFILALIEKGKSVFKKWLAFEKEQGDEAGVENVKEKAMAFVESLGEK